MDAATMTAACLALVAVLLWRDLRAHGGAGPGFWVTFLWLFLCSSRALSDWVGVGAPRGSAQAFADGSPIDRAALFALMVAGLLVLRARRLPWADLVAVNKLLVLYVLYCAASTLWADSPLLAQRRLLKDMGHGVMALVLLSDPQPVRALVALLRRLAIVLLPLSVLFILAYPDLGTARSPGGVLMYTGVTNQKNELGRLCLVLGMGALWSVLHGRKSEPRAPLADRLAMLALAATGATLLALSDSRTAMACLALVAALLAAARLPVVRTRPARVVTLAVVAGLLVFALDAALGVRETVLAWAGRDPTLTHRTGIWRVLLAMPTRPVIGEGYMSFWSGPRLQEIWHALQASILQAHNGYIEQYLNLGWIGAVFMVALLAVGVAGARRVMDTDPAGGLLKLSLVAAAALYNWSEAAFYGMNAMWMLALVGILDTRPLRR